MKTLVSAKYEMQGLRDFQQETARYAFQRLFGDGLDSTSRFLVADEVGLGKTLVARGVIAQIIEHLQREGDKRIDIVYVASNAAIATQNLRKLAPTGVPVDHHTDRLSLLPFNLGELGSRDVNLVALTPRTSMDLRSSGGTFWERAAALAALRTVWGGNRVKGRGISRVFAGGIQDGVEQTREQRVRAAAAAYGNLPPKAARIFKNALADIDRKRRAEKLPTLDRELHDLAYLHTRPRVSADAAKRRAGFIRQTREAMAWTGVQLLQPDLVILDEFQRFRELLSEDSDEWTGEIARTMFNYRHRDAGRTARVLLLSATPYVMHTTSAEAAAGSDLHYEDFLETYRFLAAGSDAQDPGALKVDLQIKLGRLRTAILDANVTGAEPVRTAAADVSAQLTRVMVRTERLASTADHNGMLETVRDPVGLPTPRSFEQYVDAARVGDHLQHAGVVHTGDVLDYWKSAPYTLSFLGGHLYMLSKNLMERVEASKSDVELLDLLRGNKALLRWRDVQSYRELDPANGRLEQLFKDMFNRGAHRLLWMPPSCPYYERSGRFDTDEARSLTKRLIFSAWTLVPTVVSTLTSYEAERRLHVEARAANATVTRYDTEASKRHTRHLQLRQGTQSMSAMIFRLPSPALASLVDPIHLSAEVRAREGSASWDGVLELATSRIGAALAGIVPSTRGSSAGSAAWYVLAPWLLDVQAEAHTGYSPQMVDSAWFVASEDSVALKRHLDQLSEWLADASQLTEDIDQETRQSILSALPAVPDDLERVLALNGLAGPATCIFRSLWREPRGLTLPVVMRQSVVAAEAFVSLLNSWEAARIVNAMQGEGDFWHKVLAYCGEGHLQAVLDEYVAVLTEWRGYNRMDDPAKALTQLVGDLQSVLTLRTSVYQVLRDGRERPERVSMRGRFAVRFGDSTSEDAQQQRVESVSLAFNSPFWPFVLTSTSVGQEGLDFHLYCHSVSHWNLPGNPVDLEQREGRIHRYKGHAVRKNVARSEGPPTGSIEPWGELFARAEQRVRGTALSDITPYWVYLPDHLPASEVSRIERHLPITPYSREASRIDSLLSSVAYYRLAFGQPRQEELVEHVLNGITDENLRREIAQVRVDLSPPG